MKPTTKLYLYLFGTYWFGVCLGIDLATHRWWQAGVSFLFSLWTFSYAAGIASKIILKFTKDLKKEMEWRDSPT